ncbi:hypothetical protein SAMN05660860_00122 [Geoalkalibacter ferrihydriticus]|uniref:Uncharacterized protein n=2 Tax=Geoalkalibacter ferrihydriticus TaxID=392333 RepID=A0A0C2HMT7_9BACT|nr:hypothetical protein [Geoalkalibacter ferrihydriticus]KIH76260.1 hypothetical protein GFER_11625 [Geoalkalibacter ferrihydriticus DSM 17813]SDL23995.1 hypothetical protein SAMN05660860_00122 [Geoalkalibacter ferrihydriticus]
MEKKWTENLKDRIETFFEAATDAEVDAILEKSNYDFYKHVKKPVLSNLNEAFTFAPGENLFFGEIKYSTSKSEKRYRKSIKHDIFSSPDKDVNYIPFKLAA